jgi:hypothetical protein
MLINGEYAYKLKLALKYMWQDYVRFTLTTCVTSVWLVLQVLPILPEPLCSDFSYSYVEVYSCNKFEFISYLLAFQ